MINTLDCPSFFFSLNSASYDLHDIDTENVQGLHRNLASVSSVVTVTAYSKDYLCFFLLLPPPPQLTENWHPYALPKHENSLAPPSPCIRLRV